MEIHGFSSIPFSICYVYVVCSMVTFYHKAVHVLDTATPIPDNDTPSGSPRTFIRYFLKCGSNIYPKFCSFILKHLANFFSDSCHLTQFVRYFHPRCVLSIYLHYTHSHTSILWLFLCVTLLRNCCVPRSCPCHTCIPCPCPCSQCCMLQ